jgi:hypothetical protein
LDQSQNPVMGALFGKSKVGSALLRGVALSAQPDACR